MKVCDLCDSVPRDIKIYCLNLLVEKISLTASHVHVYICNA